MRRPPAHRTRPAWIAVVIAVVVSAAACGRAPREEILMQLTPATPGTLTVATTLPAPGFWEGDDPTIVGGGFEWGLARALAEEFELDLDVIDVPFADIVEGKLGGADLAIAQIEVTTERRTVLDFSLPYYASDFGILMLADERVGDVAAARELRWAVVDGARQQDFIDINLRPELSAVVVTDDVAAAEAVAAGTVDAALIDLSSALIHAHDNDALGVAAKIVTGGQYAIALPKDSPNLEKVDAALRGFQLTGTMRALEESWLIPLFSTAPDEVPEFEVT